MTRQPVGRLLAKVRALPVAEQILVLRMLYERVELNPRGVTFWHREWFAPSVTRLLPRYYAPGRGRAEVGF